MAAILCCQQRLRHTQSRLGKTHTIGELCQVGSGRAQIGRVLSMTGGSRANGTLVVAGPSGETCLLTGGETALGRAGYLMVKHELTSLS